VPPARDPPGLNAWCSSIEQRHFTMHPSFEDDVQPDDDEGVDARERQAEPKVGRDALGQSCNLSFEVVVLIHPDQDTESRFVSTGGPGSRETLQASEAGYRHCY
jgi:hypothetical protein